MNDILKVDKFGDDNGIEKLTSPKWDATENDAWDMTAIATNLWKVRRSLFLLIR